MNQESYWDKQKDEIFKIMAGVFLAGTSTEGVGIEPGSEFEKSIVQNMAALGIQLESGSESEKAMLLYIAGIKKKHPAYQNRISVWAQPICLGDTICVTPTLRKIKTLYPENPIDVYSFYPDIFKHNKNVDTAILLDEQPEKDGYYCELRSFGYLRSFPAPSISEKKTEANINTTNLIDVFSLMALNALLRDNEKQLEVPVSPNEMQSLHEKIDRLGIDFSRAVVIHPSRTWATRTWPEGNWQELTRKLRRDGFQVIAVGKTQPVTDKRSKVDGNENYGMQPCPEQAVNLIDQLSVLETASLLSQCNAVITMDSGLLHLALATDIPIIALFTVIDPSFRKAWRHGSFDYKFQVVPPNGNCYYCSAFKSSASAEGRRYARCPAGLNAQCMPTVESVYTCFEKIATVSAY